LFCIGDKKRKVGVLLYLEKFFIINRELDISRSTL